MPHAFIMRFPNGTTDEYDRVIEKMGFSDGSAAPGSLFHWVAQTGDELLVVDVWDSAEEFQKFADEKIGPITAEEGIAQPTVEHHEVHNILPH
jgi:heme-degrading monooxygenase HmoA